MVRGVSGSRGVSGGQVRGVSQRSEVSGVSGVRGEGCLSGQW